MCISKFPVRLGGFWALSEGFPGNKILGYENIVKLKIIPLLNRAGASSLQESLAGPIDIQKIKGRLTKTAKNVCSVIPMPELFSVENSSVYLFKVQKLVEQVMEQTDKISSNVTSTMWYPQFKRQSRKKLLHC